MRTRSHKEHLGAAFRIWDRKLAPYLTGGSMRVQEDGRLPGELPRRVVLQDSFQPSPASILRMQRLVPVSAGLGSRQSN
jgi:hypothetical protein